MKANTSQLWPQVSKLSAKREIEESEEEIEENTFYL